MTEGNARVIETILVASDGDAFTTRRATRAARV